jgi:hypothetical protein
VAKKNLPKARKSKHLSAVSKLHFWVCRNDLDEWLGVAEKKFAEGEKVKTIRLVNDVDM